MKILELLDRDPLRIGLANNGQARITPGRDERVMRELRAELETFVCKGQFADALERILEGYLANLDASRQGAVWVSGFFGSGKSHLLKMLAHLWVNTEFDDGQTARGLVADRLPSRVRDALRELDTRARRIGRDLVAAAGSLLGGNVGHVRLSVLSIVLRARGLPEQYPQARFCFWLQDEGLLERVRGSVEAAGRLWARELNNLYVSPVIAADGDGGTPHVRGERRGSAAAPHSAVSAAEGRHQHRASSTKRPAVRSRPPAARSRPPFSCSTRSSSTSTRPPTGRRS